MFAFAIKRFDRKSFPDNPSTRIHMENFAQILVKYPHEKYNTAIYEQIGKVIYQYSGAMAWLMPNNLQDAFW